MEDIDYIYNGKRFKYREDFEQEFKPTKWSIKKYIDFLSSMDKSEKFKFLKYTLDRFENYERITKDTLSFLKRIKENYEICYRDIWGSDLNQKLTISKTNFNQFVKYIGLLQLLQDPNKKDKKSYDPFILLMAMLRNDGILEGTSKKLSKILKEQFGIKLSLSTIESKIYKFNAEPNDKNSNSKLL